MRLCLALSVHLRLIQAASTNATNILTYTLLAIGFSMTVPLPHLRLPINPQMLGDADTLASRKISDGTAVHLFQRPKTAVASVSGPAGILRNAQQPGRLDEFPPVLLRVQGAGAGGGSGATGYVNSHWEVDGPRKQIRFLASFLLLISVLQVHSSRCLPTIFNGVFVLGS